MRAQLVLLSSRGEKYRHRILRYRRIIHGVLVMFARRTAN
jgi:hypothetical protein